MKKNKIKKENKKTNFFNIKDKFSSINKKIGEFNDKTLNTIDNASNKVDNSKKNFNESINQFNSQIIDKKDKVNKYIRDTRKNTRQFFKRNKVPSICSAAVAGVLVFSLSIYFSQTLYFYQMGPIETKDGNNIKTLYSHDSYITKTYPRKVARTYSGTVSWTDSANKAQTVTFMNGNEYPSEDNNYSETHKNTFDSDYKKIYDDNRLIMSSDFINNQIKNDTLKKHPAADYQYGYANRLPDSAPAVNKYLNIDLTQPGYVTTGLYLAPGEILTIKIKGLTDAQVKNLGITLSLGESDNSSPNVSNSSQWKRSAKRMPSINSRVAITSNNFKWGTPFGGIVNIVVGKQPGAKDNKNVGLELDGAVEAISYVHGSTTEKEWKRLLKEAKAPIFDISTDHMKFIGPVSALAKGYKNITDLPYPYKSMDLFDKMALDALYTVNWNADWKQPYRITFSNYVPAGEAVSFVGASFIDAPWYWANGLLNYDSLINNGSWGIMHENNHQNQRGPGWGFISGGTGGEVTNNVLTVASYIKFTNVFSNRDGKQTATDHTSKVNGYNSLNRVASTASSSTGQERGGIDQDYSMIMEEFGTQAFQNAVRSYYNSSVKNYWGNSIKIPSGISDKNTNFTFRVSEATGYNWANYANSVKLISDDNKNKINTYYSKFNSSRESNQKVKEYLPVFSFYSSETNYDNREFVYTQTPFTIPSKYFSKGYDFDLKKYTNTTDKYELSNPKIISEPNKGKLVDSGNGKWNYKPDLSYKNGDDDFVYEVQVSKKTSQSKDSTNSDSVYYEPITVQFKVKIKLQGRTDSFVVPGNSEYQQYFTEQKTSKRDDIDGNEFNTTDQSKLNKLITYPHTGSTEPKGNKHFSNFKYIYSGNSFWHPLTKTTIIDGESVAAIAFEVHFKQKTKINYLQLNTPTSYFELPDGIIINTLSKNGSNFETGGEIYNNGFPDSSNSTFLFDNAVDCDGLKITLTTYNIVNDDPLKNENSETKPKVESQKNSSRDNNDGYNPQQTYKKAREDYIRISGIDMGVVVKPDQILTPDSNWLYHVGDWRRGQKDGKVNGTSLFTIFPLAKLEFGFSGTGFTIVGTKDIGYGSFDVYIDGKYYKTVNTNSSTRSANESLLAIPKNDLPNGDHFVTIMTRSSAPVEIQYIALNGTPKPISVNDWYYFLIIALPVIVVLTAVLITLIVLYYKKFPNKVKK